MAIPVKPPFGTPQEKNLLPDLAPVEIPQVEDFTEYSEQEPLEDIEDTEEDYVDEPEEEYEYNEDILPEMPSGGSVEDPLDNEIATETEPTEEEYDKFTDKKGLKIIPFGGKKAKIKSSDFDDRKNSITTHKIIRTVSIILIATMFLLGIKNTWFPENIYTKSEIEQLSQLAIGRTGFPSERGRAFAIDFMSAYLTIDPNKTSDDTSLEYFYTGQENVRSNVRRREISGKETQKVIISPQIFNVTPVSSKVESYKLSALVTDLTGSDEATVDGQSNARWVSFSIDVYYDKATNSLSIPTNSPTIIPKYPIVSNAKIPANNPLGNGENGEAMLSALTPTIDGYVNAYTKVNASSWNEIAQYISATPDIALYSGFGGDVTLAGSPSDSIKKIIWLTDTPGEYKAELTIRFRENRNKAAGMSMDYTAKYVMTLNSAADGKYIVTKFTPLVYVPEVKQ